MSRFLVALLTLLLAATCTRAERVSRPNSNSKGAIVSATPLSARSHEAYALLQNSECFKMAHVGDAGALPPEASAFRTLLSESNAVSAFRALAESDRMPARLYGLCGLFLKDHAMYEIQARNVLRHGGRVCTMIGCDIVEQHVSDVIGTGDKTRWEISGGVWPVDLAGENDGRTPTPKSTAGA